MGNKHMMSMKIAQLQPKFFHPLDLGRPMSNQGWLLHVINKVDGFTI